MLQNARKQHLEALGARILSEANDLKRTIEALATETNWSVEEVRRIVAGEADAESVTRFLGCLTDIYPLSLSDLWIREDDTDEGVTIFTGQQSAATSRIFERSG